jgi:co-chaperonin GroES (HSP10)
MTVGVHSFQIPHEHVQPTRDMVIVRLPMPPRMSKGGIITPDITRDLMQHNVMAGRVFAMGPLAFTYKNGMENVDRQKVEIGDWVLFRPFSGTMIQGGQIKIMSGWRYMSSFNDVIGIIPAAHMPKPETLEWDYEDEPNAPAPNHDFNFTSRKIVPLEYPQDVAS